MEMNDLFQSPAHRQLGSPYSYSSTKQTTGDMARQCVSNFPVRHPTNNIPAIFIENHQTSAEDDEKIKYVSRIDSFLAAGDAAQDELDCKRKIEESFENTTENVQALNQALGKFREKLCKRGQAQVNKPLPSGQKVNWRDVMGELENAQDYYKNRHGGGRIGAALSKFAKYTGSLRGCIDLLPAGDYGSTICGSLKLLLSAVDETYKIEGLVFEALSSIPEILYTARTYLHAYQAPRLSIVMLEKMADLFNHILIVLREIVLYCLEGKTRHFGSTILKGSNSKDNLQQAISNLKECVAFLNREADRTDSVTLQTIYRDVQDVKQRLDSNGNAEGSRTDVYVNLYVFCSAHPSLDGKGELLFEGSPQSSPAGVYYQHSISAASSPGLGASPGPSIADLSDIVSLCVDSRSQDRLSDSPKPTRHRHRSHSKPKPKPLVTTEELLHVLAFDEAKVASDRGTNVSPSKFDASELQKLPLVTSSQQFQNWIDGTRKTNASLLVQGHFDSLALASALTHLCANVAYESAPSPKILILTHFCALHASSREEIGRRAGATGLIASFVGQLLSYDSHRANFDLSVIDQSALSMIEDDSFDALCWLFGILVSQVKKGITILCMIDSISSYETPDKMDDVILLVRRLQTWVVERNMTSSKPRLKLLITDPNQTTKTYQCFAPDDILNLDGDEIGVDSGEDSWII